MSGPRCCSITALRRARWLGVVWYVHGAGTADRVAPTDHLLGQTLSLPAPPCSRQPAQSCRWRWPCVPSADSLRAPTDRGWYCARSRSLREVSAHTQHTQHNTTQHTHARLFHCSPTLPVLMPCAASCGPGERRVRGALTPHTDNCPSIFQPSTTTPLSIRAYTPHACTLAPLLTRPRQEQRHARRDAALCAPQGRARWSAPVGFSRPTWRCQPPPLSAVSTTASNRCMAVQQTDTVTTTTTPVTSPVRPLTAAVPLQPLGLSAVLPSPCTAQRTLLPGRPPWGTSRQVSRHGLTPTCSQSAVTASPLRSARCPQPR